MSNIFKVLGVVRRLLASFLCLIFIGGSAWAQEGKTVSGTVSDSSGEALIGITVMISGTLTGTVTDASAVTAFPA